MFLRRFELRRGGGAYVVSVKGDASIGDSFPASDPERGGFSSAMSFSFEIFLDALFRDT
jgi:hypothetical protein